MKRLVKTTMRGVFKAIGASGGYSFHPIPMFRRPPIAKRLRSIASICQGFLAEQ